MNKYKVDFEKYFYYLVRWQLSTPILAPCVNYFSNLGFWWSAAIANLIGGLIFFWVDALIFKSRVITKEVWEVKQQGVCHDCGIIGRVYRLIKAPGYDRSSSDSIMLCEKCSTNKYNRIKGLQ